MIGPFDAKTTRYATTIRFLTSRMEIISALKDDSRTFENFSGSEKNKFDDVLENEVEAIRKACTALKATYKPKSRCIRCII